jgi:NADH-quinone oxidoreductase subunit L
VSAYSAAVFHLMTHAFFKALLFLAAGSVIIGMHHEQDMRYMGGLRRKMPITWITSWIGTLALVGTPFLSGFYSKDTIIEAAGHHADSHGGWIAQYGYWAVLLGAFVTAFYSFRLLYLTFHGKPRWHDKHAADYVVPEADSTEHEQAIAHEHEAHGHDDHPHEPHESPWVVTLPLVLLAIPSLAIGFFTVGPMLFGTDWTGHHAQDPFFLGAIDLAAARDTVALIGAELWHGPVAFALHGFMAPAFWLAFAGFLLATVMYLWMPGLPAKAARILAWPKRVLERKYWADDLWIGGFAGGGVKLGHASRAIDSRVIDGVAVNGTARLVDLAAGIVRRVQSGLLFHYAFAMILGLIVLLAVLIRYWT